MNCTITKPVQVSGHIFVLVIIGFPSFHGLEFGTVPTVWYLFLFIIKYYQVKSMWVNAKRTLECVRLKKNETQTLVPRWCLSPM